MRCLLFTFGFALSLAIAASSFATLMTEEGYKNAPSTRQTFFIPQNGSVNIGECLADRSGCGRSAAESVCESRGFTQVVSFGEAAPEDMTGSIDRSGVKVAAKKDVPVLVTCSN